MTNAQEDRAFTEFDLSALGGRPVRDALVTGGIAVNNSLAVGVRQFHILTYDADGVAALSDFDLPGTVTATTAYDPPNTIRTTFSAPVTTAVNSLISRGVTHLGIRVQCVAPITCAANVLSPVPELVVTP